MVSMHKAIKFENFKLLQVLGNLISANVVKLHDNRYTGYMQVY